jgi:uncharacterized membrane protein YedE/YeeE
MKQQRAVLSIASIVWLLWFALATAANVQEFGTVLPPGPIEAHDFLDLLFWGALMALTYLTPFVLALCWTVAFKNRRKSAE